MKSLFSLTILLFGTLLSCSNPTNSSDNLVETHSNNQQDKDSISVQDDDVDSIQLFEEPVTKFNGSWFSIQYPESFTPSPDGPLEEFNDYEHVETDEATFTSKQGEVAFFVYSPQWGGEPENYLEIGPNETLASIKEKDTGTEDWPETTTWYTFAAKDNSYTRAAVSVETESTDLVFGIKYARQSDYDKYKPAYLAFKKSLEQYAD